MNEMTTLCVPANCIFALNHYLPPEVDACVAHGRSEMLGRGTAGEGGAGAKAGGTNQSKHH